MSGPWPAPEFGSADAEVTRLVAVFARAWAAAPTDADPIAVAAEVVERHRHGAWQLTDHAVLALVASALLALSQQAATDPTIVARLYGAERLFARFRAILDGAGGPERLEDPVVVTEEALEREPTDPQSFETLAALGLLVRWRASLG